MKQGDVYLRKEDNRLYAVAMLGIGDFNSEDKKAWLAIIRPLRIIDNEADYYVVDSCLFEGEFSDYEYLYNLYDKSPKEDVEG